MPNNSVVLLSAVYDAHGTPTPIVTAAQVLMGGIDLDPASSELGNARVGAAQYFDRESNGLIQKWRGKVFLNPPGGLMKCTAITEKDPREKALHLENNKLIASTRDAIQGLPWYRKSQSIATIWVDRLLHSYATGEIDEAVLIVFNGDLLGARPELYDFPMIRTAYTDRVKAWNEAGKTPVVNSLGRVCYLDQHGRPGDSPTHTSAIVYLPPRTGDIWDSFQIDLFGELFSEFGVFQPPSRKLTGHFPVPAQYQPDPSYHCDRCANQRDGECIVDRYECSIWNKDGGISFFDRAGRSIDVAA